MAPTPDSRDSIVWSVPILDLNGMFLGTAVPVAPRLLVTCRHVIDEYLRGQWLRCRPASDIWIVLPGNQSRAAATSGIKDRNIACISIDRSGPEGIPGSDDNHDDIALLTLADPIC